MVSVLATVRGKGEVSLAARYASPRHVEAEVFGRAGSALTGSAVPLAEVTVETAEGGLVKWGEITQLRPASPAASGDDGEGPA